MFVIDDIMLAGDMLIYQSIREWPFLFNSIISTKISSLLLAKHRRIRQIGERKSTVRDPLMKYKWQRHTK